ncbi:MAG: HPr kinase/phosphatase C-terminal domain-containing protein [Alphaproteobacteria bacterium]|nr:HPr kinase/phosphatase C-terminal domain-containing protein [Alphaproteobacteria bacterium]
MINIHATLVNIQNKGVLICGKSGSGKSDLALRLIMDNKANLVADDRVDIEIIDNKLVGSSPSILRKKLEIRNVGILVCENVVENTEISLVVELVDKREMLERFPEAEFQEILGVNIPKIRLYAFDCSTNHKIIQKISGKFI